MANITRIFQGDHFFKIKVSNIITLTKLVIKELIESSMKSNRMVNSDNLHLKNFFILFEHLMLHRMKVKSGLLTLKKDIWGILGIIEAHVDESFNIIESVQKLSSIKTPLGKFRAWLRFAFVQKVLPDYFQVMVDKRNELLAEFYEQDAFLMSEEAILLQGLIVGLNIIDCNWCAKDDDLDYQKSLIDIIPYLRDIKTPITDECTSCSKQSDLKTILDQKNYLEELNRRMSAKVSLLQKKLIGVNNLNEKSQSDVSINLVLETNQNNDIIQMNSLEFQLAQERDRYQQLEKNFYSLSASKNESDTALRLLEKDIHEKQDTIVSIRRQLEDIKAINIQMYNKLKECDEQINFKEDKITSLEQRNCILGSTILQLEGKLATSEKRKSDLETLNDQLNEKIAVNDKKRILLENELKKEKDWRTSLQSIIDEQQEQITAIQSELDDLKASSSETQSLIKECDNLKKICSDYELSLEEIGAQLKESRLESENLKESVGMLKDAVWTKDSEALICCGCEKPFSLSRRKHHCRNCGNIYCGFCSNNKLPLPSSAKPVRVCDSCHTLLLNRYCAN